MAMSIKTNVSSLEAQKNLLGSTGDLDKSLAKLSSGYRITKAQDDAAGLAIAVNLGAQIKSYNQAVRNGNDALNVVQTADSSLNETQNILTRLRELASQSASSGVSNTERGYIQNEVDRPGQRNRSYRQRDRVQRRGADQLGGGADLPGRYPQRGGQRPDRRHHHQRDARPRWPSTRCRCRP